MKAWLILLLVCLITACAGNPAARYAKSGATQGEFDEAVYRCKLKSISEGSNRIRDAYGKVTILPNEVNCDKFNACMSQKGFKKSAKGDFSASNDDEVTCKQ